MEKLQITKDKIAQKYGFEAWNLFEFSRTPGLNIEALIDETITEYSSELLRQNREMKEALIKINQKANNSDYEYRERIFDINGYVIDCLTSCKKGKE